MNAGDLTVVVLVHNRKGALRHTLAMLTGECGVPSGNVVVVDNASTDGSADGLGEEFAGVRVLRQATNRGVAAFNAGAREAATPLVMLLDDDAWPEPAALRAALALFGSRERLGGVALLPVHPATRKAEWRTGVEGPERAWPMMGCGNIVRREAWDRLGGYEEKFFLYRNDTDLALKLLGAGWEVAFDPAWVVWHDSPAAAKKSERWLRLATRNWIWMARRHGRGVWRWVGIGAGAAWAVRLAGVHPRRLWRVMRGVWEGLMRPAPHLPMDVHPDGAAWRDLVRRQLRRGGAKGVSRGVEAGA